MLAKVAGFFKRSSNAEEGFDFGPSQVPEEVPANRQVRLIRLAGATCVLVAGLLVGFNMLPTGEDIPSDAEAAMTQRQVETLPRNESPDAKTDMASTDGQVAAPQDDGVETQKLVVSSGDTLMKMLTGAGIDQTEAFKAIKAMSHEFSPRQIKPGHEIELEAEEAPSGGPTYIKALRLLASATQDVVVTRGEAGDYKAETIERPTVQHLVRAEGDIDTSLYEAAVKARVPLPVLGKLIDIFSYDVDFQREVQKGDHFALMYEGIYTEDGKPVDYGNVLVGEMVLSGNHKRFYRYTDKNGFTDYFNDKGQSVRKALLRTPIEGARISSGFGKRKHPILGYTKVHKGTDFAAPRGTPIFAAGDGVVEVAGWVRGFGNYVRIRHNGTYSTAYGHMMKFAKGIRKGKRVSQHQVIGYVGTTGRSTGPHLHYEVLKFGHQVNPLGVKLPTGKTLEGQELARFDAIRDQLEGRYAKLTPQGQLAELSEGVSRTCSTGSTKTC